MRHVSLHASSGSPLLVWYGIFVYRQMFLTSNSIKGLLQIVNNSRYFIVYISSALLTRLHYQKTFVIEPQQLNAERRSLQIHWCLIQHNIQHNKLPCYNSLTSEHTVLHSCRGRCMRYLIHSILLLLLRRTLHHREWGYLSSCTAHTWGRHRELLLLQLCSRQTITPLPLLQMQEEKSLLARHIKEVCKV